MNKIPDEALIVSQYCSDIEVDGVVQYSSEENLWVALIGWNAVHEIKEIAAVSIS